MRRTALMLVPLLVALCACGGARTAHTARAAGGHASATPSSGYLWQRTDLKPATRPVLVGGRIVLYTQDGTFLSVTALDPATGRTVWTQRASDSFITGGVAFGLTTVGKDVVFLEPAEVRGRPLARATRVDAASGKRVWSSDTSALFLDMPDDCDGDATELCASGALDGVGAGMLRLAKRDGSLRLIRMGKQLPRALGAQLYDTGARRPDFVARIANGRQVWRRPLSAMFGDDVSSDSGWSWHAFSGTLVGSMGLRRDPAQKTLDLAAWTQVGIDKTTGRTLWRVPGRQLQCLGAVEDVIVKGDDLPYRCAYTGIAKLLAGGGVDGSAVSVVIEGFDLRSGRTTWQVDVGRSPAMAFGDAGPVGLGGSVVAIPRPGRPPMQLDLRTGKHQELATIRPGWCSVQNPFRLSSSAAYEGERQGETLQVPCRSDGSPLPAPAPEVAGWGVRAAGALVWAAPDGLRAVRA